MTENYRIRGADINGATSFDAERWGPDDWRYTGPEWAGMLRSTRGSLIMALADLIGERKVYSIDGPAGVIPYGRLVVNKLGGAWVDGRYLPFHELADRVIPEKWEDG